MEPIVNKVAKSGLVTIDLQQFLPTDPIVEFDLKDYLYMELILKEKDFREALDNYDWSQVEHSILAVHCSTDAIIAQWAFMLVSAKAHGFARKIQFGNKNQVREYCLLENIRNHDWKQYEGKKVLLKGCSDQDLPPSAYLEASREVQPYADRLMYGEACSFVPVYRKSKSPVS
jgi:hypothetical protein